MLTKTAEKMIRLAQGGAYDASAREVKKHVIWDTRYFDTAASSRTMFSVPVGGGWVGGVNKTWNETNLDDPGKLPNGQEMVFTHIAPHFCIHYPDKTTPDLADIVRSCLFILENSIFELSIRNKAAECQVHGSEFEPRPIFLAGLQDNAADTEDVFQIGDGVSFGWLKLDPVPIPLGNGQGFTVDHTVTNGDPAVVTALNASSSTLHDNDVTMQVLLAGITTHAK